MKYRGNLVDITKLFNGKYRITYELTEGEIQSIAEQKDDLSIEVKKWRNGRTKNANGLLWHCIGEIANAFDLDKWRVYLNLLKSYGQFTYICVPPKAVEMVKAQWRECEEIGPININGREAIQLLCYYGSSTYNTKEFAHLLEGTISEMKDCGLPTPTSEEMKRSLKEWEKVSSTTESTVTSAK